MNTNKTFCAFKVGRGGRFHNPNHVTFVGFRDINTFTSELFTAKENFWTIYRKLRDRKLFRLLDKLDECRENNDFSFFEKKFGFDFGKDVYTDGDTHLVGLNVENDGTGLINIDGGYNSTYVRFLEDCDENECQMILEDYLTTDEVKEFINSMYPEIGLILK